MQFKKENIDDFKNLFDTVKLQIARFPGCYSLKLLQDKHLPHVFFTYSIWEDEKALDNYRKSDLFAETWQKTKVLFESKASASTTIELFDYIKSN